jgi:hypothetical protein
MEEQQQVSFSDLGHAMPLVNATDQPDLLEAAYVSISRSYLPCA